MNSWWRWRAMHWPITVPSRTLSAANSVVALDRTQPGLPMKKGRAGTMTHDYLRHGTLVGGIVIEDRMDQFAGRHGGLGR